MNALQTELNRLYRHGTEDGRVRGLVLSLAKPADWSLLSTVWRGVQSELELPAPAIAVSGVNAYQLWFSLEEPVALSEGLAFLEALRLRYLADVATTRTGLLLAPPVLANDAAQHAREVPALQAENGMWSAFVASDLAAIFADEPWLDLAPNPDAQASLLSQMKRIKPAAFQSAVQALRPKQAAQATSATAPRQPVPVVSSRGANSQDPKQFLLEVMGDTSIDLWLRVEAAKALMPYCEGKAG